MLVPLALPGADLVRVRDGARASSRRSGPSSRSLKVQYTQRRQLDRLRRGRPADRDPRPTTTQFFLPPERDPAADDARDRRARGQALLQRVRRRHQGHRARVHRRRRPAAADAGRLDDHRAVRQGALHRQSTAASSRSSRRQRSPSSSPTSTPRTRSSPPISTTSYFGNGAYGIEAAAQTYFGNDPSSTSTAAATRRAAIPRTSASTKLTVADAALLAGAGPEPADQRRSQNADAALRRRNLVLRDMFPQGYITRRSHQADKATPLPPPQYVDRPVSEATNPGYGYFVSWVEQQMLAPRRSTEPLHGRLRHPHDARTAPLQKDAQNVVEQHPAAGHRRPVGGARRDRQQDRRGARDGRRLRLRQGPVQPRDPGRAPAGLGVEGLRPRRGARGGLHAEHEGPSAPFDLHAPRRSARSPSTTTRAATRTSKIPLSQALAFSDNSVFARVGPRRRRARRTQRRQTRARASASRPSVSLNPSMMIGGLTRRHAARHGPRLLDDRRRTASSSAARSPPTPAPAAPRRDHARRTPPPADGTCPGPVGITRSSQPATSKLDIRDQRAADVPGLRPTTGQRPRQSMMQGVLSPTAPPPRRPSPASPVGQDRDDHELRRRLVRRLHAEDRHGPDDDRRRLGRLPDAEVDGARPTAASRSTAAPTRRSSATTSSSTQSGSPPKRAMTAHHGKCKGDWLKLKHRERHRRRRRPPTPLYRNAASDDTTPTTPATTPRPVPRREHGRPPAGTGGATSSRHDHHAARHDHAGDTTTPTRHRHDDRAGDHAAAVAAARYRGTGGGAPAARARPSGAAGARRSGCRRG